MSARIESLDTSAEERSGHVVKVNGKHRIEGHMGLLREIFESVREFDPSIGPDMPAHYLDPVSISQLFGLPLEEVAPWALEKRDSEAGFSEDDRRDRVQSADINGLERIAEAIERIAEHVVPEPRPIVGTSYVAERIGCTPTWITDLVRRGEIPENCCVEGTGNGKPWKFHRKKIDQWLRSR